VASARIEEKIKLMELGPDMMAVCFNAHDEYFQPEPSLPPKRMMAIHPVEELMAYAKAAEEHKVKLECECFTDRRVLAPRIRAQQGYLRDKTYTDAVHRLARRHLDAADRTRAAVHGRQPAAELHLERERDESREAVADLCARGRARRPCARRLRGQSLHGAGRSSPRTTPCWSSAWWGSRAGSAARSPRPTRRGRYSDSRARSE
jgi:hypothetical protein